MRTSEKRQSTLHITRHSTSSTARTILYTSTFVTLMFVYPHVSKDIYSCSQCVCVLLTLLPRLSSCMPSRVEGYLWILNICMLLGFLFKIWFSILCIFGITSVNLRVFVREKKIDTPHTHGTHLAIVPPVPVGHCPFE